MKWGRTGGFQSRIQGKLQPSTSRINISFRETGKELCSRNPGSFFREKALISEFSEFPEPVSLAISPPILSLNLNKSCGPDDISSELFDFVAGPLPRYCFTNLQERG